ncbi:3-oxoacyl-[acyl-carrier-protein] synthase III C-terminal domain-containing protein [Cupriavidus basilensis]
MKLEAIQVALPSKIVTNSDILALIREYTGPAHSGVSDDVLKAVDFFLRYAGSEKRHWLAEGESPIALLRDAGMRAMEQAGVVPNDIDLLIYVGIGRGFIEPGGAYHAANALGLRETECFDIIDACMSWMRAMHLSQTLLRSGAYRRIMVVNAEFNMIHGGAIYPALFDIKDRASLEWTFPAFTLGEAASATIVCADGVHGRAEAPWVFAFESRPDLADLCNIPIHGFERFATPSERIGKNGCGRFTSYGSKLVDEGRPHILRVMRSLGKHVPLLEATALFTHASSKRDWQDFADAAELGHLLYSIFPTTGNIVSASVPAAIASAAGEGHIARGDRLLGWVGSAGMSYGAGSFIY